MKILEQSLKLALTLEGDESKFNIFGFLFDRSKLVSVGRNQMLKTSKLAYDMGRKFNIEHWMKFPFLHAELSTISKYWDKQEITGRERLVVVRFDKRGRLAMAKPCSNCQDFLKAVGIAQVYYSMNGDFNELIH